MNLKSLNMINFGVFGDRKVEFCPGFNLIFGPNESGKTTIVDAIVSALLSRSSKRSGELKNIPKFIKNRYGSEMSLHLVAEHDAEQLTFPAPESFQDRWGVGWDEMRAIFIAREGDLRLVEGDPREFRQWWDALKGKLLGFEEEPNQVLKKIAAEAGLTPNLGLTRTEQERIEEAQDKLDWYQQNEDKIRSLRALENAHRDLQSLEKRLIQEVEHSKKGLLKAKLLRAKDIYRKMKAAEQELLEKHGRYTEEDLREWEAVKAKLDKESALLERLRQQKEQEEEKHRGAEAEATNLIKQVGILGARLSRAVDKETQLSEAARLEEMEQVHGIPIWTPWIVWGLAILALILGLYSTPLLFIACALLAGLALYLTYRLRRTTGKTAQFLQQKENLLAWGRELGLEASSLRDLQRKIEDLRQEKAKRTGQQAQLEGHLKKTANELKSLIEQKKAKVNETDKIRAKIQTLRDKTGLGELEELQSRVKSKEELQSNVEKKYKSELKVLLGLDEASWSYQLDELKTLEDVQPMEDERLVDKLNKDLETCRRDQGDKYRDLTKLKAELKANFGVERQEEVAWKVADLRRELWEAEILQRAGQKVRQMFHDLLQKSDAILDEIIEGETVCEGFQRVTGGKYRTVTMENLSLRVTDAQGQEWDFSSLSTGTKDQLLTMLRLALAEKRLHGKGFLIFDDALVTSDRTRLRQQMEMLGRLTQEGWQILSLTAQDEVRQEADRLAELGVDVSLLDL